MNSRIAIIISHPALDTIPSLCAAIEFLAEHGYYIDIFTRMDKNFEFPKFNSNKIEIFISRTAEQRITASWFTYLRHLYSVKVLLRPIKHMLKKLLEVPLLPQASILQQRHKEISYKAIVGVDSEGLETAGHIADLLHVPLIYWSLELLLSRELTDKNIRILKEREVMLSRKADIIVIQDEERAKLMAMDNDIPMNKFLFIPNAPIISVQQKSTNYWHQHFELKEHQHVVLYAGSLGDWTGIKEIISSVNDWPEDWVLIVHTRYDSGKIHGLPNDLQAFADPNRLFFSTQPVPRIKYPELVRGADMGIAFYLPSSCSPFTQENIHTIGLSSGKIAYYLEAGRPVIVNRWPSISKLVENEGCGIVVESASEIGDAIRRITQRYKDYKNNARNVFERYLEPSRSLKHFIMRIDRL